jgi:hypothetical protein
MRHELETCANTDEVLNVRQCALAAEIYAKQVNDTNAERQIASIRLRAERRLGELLKEMKQTGQREDGRQTPRNRRSTGATVSQPTTLAQIGLTKDQSSKFQQLADVPREQFEEAVSNSSALPTTEGVINRAKQHRSSSADAPHNGSGSRGMPPLAQWVTSRLIAFDTSGAVAINAEEITAQMSPDERRSVARVAGLLIPWLRSIIEAIAGQKVPRRNRKDVSQTAKLSRSDPRQLSLPDVQGQYDDRNK